VSPFGWLDSVVLGVYFVGVLAVGLWFGRGERGTHDYFLGARRQHWLAVGMSIIATEVSALTFISVPADSFRSDWNYLQMYAGSFLGRMLIVLFLLPAFYGASVTTVYEYLGRRFGPWTRLTGSLMFFASRIIGSGIRLLAASIAISAIFGWSLVWVLVGSAGIAVVYTTYGGIKAIIWTDALQALVFIGAGLAAIAFLLYATPGSFVDNISAAYQAGKLDTFTWDLNPNNERTFWVLMIHATVMNMAALGTDQDLTQRMLTCPDLRRGQRSLIFNAFAGLPVVCLFLLIGSLMFVYFSAVPMRPLSDEVSASGDRIFPYLIAHHVPANYGLKGLLIAGVFAAAMSSLDSALGAMSSTAVTDFYKPWMRARRADEARSDDYYLLIARLFSLLFAAILVAVALAFAKHDELLWEVFRWVGLIFGAMLGVFVLGVATKNRGDDRLNALAMVTSVAFLVVLKYVQESTGHVYIAWPWWVVIGTAWTFVVGVCLPTRASQNSRARE